MTWFERHLGIDGVDTVIHLALTGIGIVIVNSVFGGAFGTVLSLKVIGGSLVVFAWRRHRAFKRRGPGQPVGLTSGQMAAERFAEMEQRLVELEAGQARVMELEERLDFAERLLAQSSGERALPGGQGRTHG